MSIVRFEFKLPEEQEEMQITIDAAKWRHIVWQIDHDFRGVVKYGNSIVTPEKTATKQEIDFAEKFREYLHELMKEENLSFD